MGLNGYLSVIASEATQLASAADEAGLDAFVTTCPGWTMNDLVLHVGEVHRWATAAVAAKATKLSEVPADSLGALPEPAAATDWLRRGAITLCETLADGDPCFEYAAFLTDPASPRLLFWARRQAMETSVHRADAESALGRCTQLAHDVALDGIDEFVTGFLPRTRTPLRTDEPHSLQIAPDYSEQRWTVLISSEMPVTERRAADAPSDVDCCVSGSASDIYLALWNRASLDALKIEGDRSSIDMLRGNVQIRWG
jgi:uncharacterized protein (TIGR03083 family)